MFKCYNCGDQTKAGDSEIKVVIEARAKVYDHVRFEGRPPKRKRIEWQTEGYETIKEVGICKYCEAARLEQEVNNQVKEVKEELDVTGLFK